MRSTLFSYGFLLSTFLFATSAIAQVQYPGQYPHSLVDKVLETLDSEPVFYVGSKKSDPELVAKSKIENAFNKEFVRSPLAAVKKWRGSGNQRSIFKVTFEQDRLATLSAKERRESLQRALKQLAEDADWVEPVRDFPVVPHLLPDDPFMTTSGSWGQSYNDMWGLYQIDAPDAWEITTGDPDLIIAVVDSGGDYNHPDFKERVWFNPAEVPDVNMDGLVDFYDVDTDADGEISQTEWDALLNGVDDDLDGSGTNGYVDDIAGWNTFEDTSDIYDGFGHGTHVAGTLGATTNNMYGISGVNWDSKVQVVRVYNEFAHTTSEALANGIIYAADNGARVINNSWGGIYKSELIYAAVAYAVEEKGVVVVYSSGNSAVELSFFHPQDSPHVINVGASNEDDELVAFSNFGATLDVVAPGGGGTSGTFNILSLLSEGSFLDTFPLYFQFKLGEDDEFLRLAGTSMAAPHVAGAASLILSIFPDYTPEEVRQMFRVSADDVADTGWDNSTGYGRLNAYEMFTAFAPSVSSITYPRTDESLVHVPDSELIDVTGTTTSRFGTGTEYRLEYGSGKNPTTWQTIVDWTSTQIVDGLLGQWDVSSLAPGDYVLRLTTEDIISRQFEDRVGVTLQPKQLPDKWPLTIEGTNLLSSPKIADLDGDGEKEVILLSNEKLHVLDSTGIPATRGPWPLDVLSLSPAGITDIRFYGDVAIGDFDTSDPMLEIIALAEGVDPTGQVIHVVNVIRSDGTFLNDTVWPKVYPAAASFEGRVTWTPILVDWDLDFDLDLLAFVGDKLRAFRLTGEFNWSPVAVLDISATAGGMMSAVGNIDFTAPPEIVFFDVPPATPEEVDLVAYNVGQPVTRVDLFNLLEPWLDNDIDYVAPRYVTLANLDDDFNLEVIGVVANMRGDIVAEGFTVFALDETGSLLPGWPKSFDDRGEILAFFAPMARLAPVDLDGDGISEIIATIDGAVEILEADGSSYNPSGPSEFFTLESGVIVGDAGDGDAEVELIGNSVLYASYIWDLDGEVLSGWPYRSDLPLVTSAVLGDLDDDGLNELVLRDGDFNGLTAGDPSTIVAFDLDGAADAPWPMYRGDLKGSNALGHGFHLRGDVNLDGIRDLADGITMLQMWSGPLTATPYQEILRDVNDDELFDIADIIYYLLFLFSDGDPPIPFDGYV